VLQNQSRLQPLRDAIAKEMFFQQTVRSLKLPGAAAKAEVACGLIGTPEGVP